MCVLLPPTHSGAFPVTNARYFVTAFPVNYLANNSRWNVQTTCGAAGATFGTFNNNNTGIIQLNTTSTSIVLPTAPNTMYKVTVSATCLLTDSCSPATIYGEYAAANPLVFSSGGSQAQTLTEYVGLPPQPHTQTHPHIPTRFSCARDRLPYTHTCVPDPVWPRPCPPSGTSPPPAP